MKELKASDIVRITGGRASFSTAGKWLKSTNPSLSVALLLEYISAENNADVCQWPTVAATCAKLNKSVRAVGGIQAAARIVNERSDDKGAGLAKDEGTISDMASQSTAGKKDIPFARCSGASYDKSADMKYKVVGNMVKFACDRKWWMVEAVFVECYAGDRLVRMDELSLL